MSDYIRQTITVSSCQSDISKSVLDKDSVHYRHGRKEQPAACRLEKTPGGGDLIQKQTNANHVRGWGGLADPPTRPHRPPHPKPKKYSSGGEMKFE